MTADVFRCSGTDTAGCEGLVAYDGDWPACPCCGLVYRGIGHCGHLGLVRGRDALPQGPAWQQPDWFVQQGCCGDEHE